MKINILNFLMLACILTIVYLANFVESSPEKRILLLIAVIFAFILAWVYGRFSFRSKNKN